MIIFKREGETSDQAFKRTLEERQKQIEEHRKPKSWDEKFICYDGFLRIIYDKQLIEVCVSIEDSEAKPISFKQLLKKYNVKYHKYGVIYVWFEEALKGEIWIYGNDPSCKEWFFYGETNGYA